MRNLRGELFVLAIAAILTIVPAHIRAQTDHLECFKIKDELKLKGFVDLDSPQYGLHDNCRISKAKYFCVPANKTVVQASSGSDPITPLDLLASPAPGDRICYSVRCPSQELPDQFVTDQFGQRMLTKLKTKLVCTPAVKGAAYCGDGIINGVEDCEPGDVGSVTCEDLGFGEGGTLGCAAGCTFNTAACVSVAGCGEGTEFDAVTGECTPDSIISTSPVPPPGYGLFLSKAEDSWDTRRAMPTARHAHASATANGKIYIIGGYSVANEYLATVEEYDPTTDTWATKAPMPTARAYLAASAVNGLIYAIGGSNTASPNGTGIVEAYDPAADTWSTKAAMPTARLQLAAADVDGLIYGIGGRQGGVQLATVEQYDPISDSWTGRAPMPTERSVLAAVALGGVVYAIGGYNGAVLSSVEGYDPIANSWATYTAMPTGRYQLAAEVLGDKILALGGQSGAARSEVEQYDPDANDWITKTPMPTGRSALSATVVDERLYAIGGFSSEDLSTVEFYDLGAFFVYERQ